MNNNDILARLDLGSSVAENDENLAKYFIPTVALQDLLADRYDLIRGVKGSGKSAILRVISSRKDDYPSLTDVRFHIATEHTGEPGFKRAFGTLREGQYNESSLVDAWKTYLINLALDVIEDLPDCGEVKNAISYAERNGLRFRTTNPFKKMWWSLLRVLHIKSFTVGTDSIAAEFPDEPPAIWTNNEESVIDFAEMLRLCVTAFAKTNVRCWLLIDRLDAAFQDNPNLETIALRALIVAYKDFMGHPELRIKLLFRTDLFDQVVTNTGFRELTHVQDRTSPPISWDADRLLHMIMERFAFNESIREKYGFTKESIQDREMRELLFLSIFPNQVDVGKRKPNTWNWMLSRIRDGNSVRTPRDLHMLIQNAARRQSEILSLGGSENAEELISSSAIKTGLAQLSSDKLQTTLIAENPDLANDILAFIKQKAEHNEESLNLLLGSDWRQITARLVRIGLLEEVANAWKVPLLYRDGLEVIQGAAFDREESE